MSGSTQRRAATKKVVVIAPNWLGDAVMCLPALGRVAGAPGVSLAVCTPPYTARVFDGLDGIDELWVDRSRGRPARVRERARALSAYGADAALIFPPSFSSALAPWLARVRRRVAYAGEGRGPLLTRALRDPGRSAHLSGAYTALADAALEEIGRGANPTAAVPALRVRPRDREAVRVRRERAGADGPYVVVVPGAAYGPAKSWPAERYRRMCEAIAPDVRVVLAGSASDRERCGGIASGLAGVVNLAGETTLGEFFALAADADVVVANDSGAPHVAAALGTPVVVLFGSTSPAWTAPLGPRVDVLQHVVPCNPCFRRTCPTQLECFNGIPVEHVAASVRAARRAGRATPTAW